MTKTKLLVMGIFLYLLLLLIIMNFDIQKMLDLRGVVAVFIGMCLLTAFQWQKKQSIDQMLSNARWNVFFAGLLTTLLSLLSNIGGEAFTPLIYGSVFYLLIDWFIKSRDTSFPNDDRILADKKRTNSDPYDVQIVTRILSKHDFTPRERHVALKIMMGNSNKEIASQLFISEQTVKKHIQNMFKKCGASDRQSFIEIYLNWFESEQDD